MYKTLDQLRLNVGFLIGQSVGSSRDFDVAIPNIHLDEDIDLKDLQGSVHASRTAQGILLQSSFQAELPAECGRCLVNYTQTLKTDFTEHYNFAHRSNIEGELILPETAQLNLLPLVREYLLLEIPINPQCKPDCKGLCPVCGENLNLDDHHHPDELIDPRFSILGSLLNEDE